MEDSEKLSEAGQELAKAGASKGGKARVQAMSPEERKELASKAGKARWAKANAAKSVAEKPQEPQTIPIPEAKHYGYLNISGIELPCYVLDDGRRVIGRTATTHMLTGIRGGGDLERYLGIRSLKPFIDINFVLEGMVSFHLPEVEGLGKESRGLPSDLLIEICHGFVAALEASRHPGSDTKLTDRQTDMAIRAGMFLAACAKVGLDALVDEATGYHYERAEDALQVKLRACLEDHMRPWEKTFPDEVWVEFGRMTGWKGPPTKRPKYYGQLVNELVCGYLDEEVVQWLRENTPPPRHGQNYHQWLSSNFGLKKLVEHIWMLIGIAKGCDSITDLRRKMAEIYGRVAVQYTVYLPVPKVAS